MYHTKTLEFEKVLEKLICYAKTNLAKELILNTEIKNDFEEIKKSLKMTKEAFDSIVKLSDIPLGGLFDVKASLDRAQIQGILNERELLNVVGLIDASDNVINSDKIL